VRDQWRAAVLRWRTSGGEGGVAAASEKIRCENLVVSCVNCFRPEDLIVLP
jgi:hypothetical protein